MPHERKVPFNPKVFDEMEETEFGTLHSGPSDIPYEENHAQREFDCLMKMRNVLLDHYGCSSEYLDEVIPPHFRETVNVKDHPGFSTYLSLAPLGITKVYDRIYKRACSILDTYPSVADKYK